MAPKLARALFSLLLILLWVNLAAADGDLAFLQRAGKVRVAVYGDTPPFSFVDQNGRHQGFVVNLGRQIAQDILGSPDAAEFVVVSQAERIAALQSGRADIVLANLTVTPERLRLVEFAYPYLKTTIGVVSRGAQIITDAAALENQTLVVVEGGTAESFFRGRYPKVRLLKFPDNAEAINAFMNGSGVGLAHDSALLSAWIKNNPGYVKGIDSVGDVGAVAPAVKLGNLELSRWLSDEIADLTKDNFFMRAYQETLLPVYGPNVDPRTVIFSFDELRMP
ncbi:MAG: transporter substrate-binding domain-containing protein [Deltaproteobacteria bacterium]|jgi:polar amino acid transport system substrate-binding protein|nr:transporter substrate-binding domain-containing protein [Deltaproteobacteria bacterium]